MTDSSGEVWQRREWLTAALAALAGIGGCGGGVESGGTGTGQAPPTLSVGTVSGFGSVIVNGVRYDDAAAAIEDDDAQPLTSAQLKLGMRATVQASAITTTAGVSSATARSIAVRSDIVGPIEFLDTARAQMTVLGQRVAITASTVFDNALPMGLAALAVGDVLELHGSYNAASGQYVASRVERRSGTTTYKLRAAIAASSLTERTLTIGTAVIDWSGVAPADPATVLAPGAVVRVTLAAAAVAGVWRATSLAVVSTLLPDRQRVEFEGRITAFSSTSNFQINGLPVNASAATFPNGTAGLVLGARVEVKGSASGGVILAQVVEIEGDDNAGGVELHGDIESVNAGAQRFVVRGTTVAWSGATRFDSSAPADIVVGRPVEVKGRLSADGTYVDATEIHVER